MYDFVISLKRMGAEEFSVAVTTRAENARQALEGFNHADADFADMYWSDERRYEHVLFYDDDAGIFYKVTREL